MTKRALNFWTLLLVSFLLASLAISFFYWVIHVAIFLLFVLILTPIIYLLLRRMTRPRILTEEDEELKHRE
jgi:multisubunit Na+/H+ antiporter MnhG subunit